MRRLSGSADIATIIVLLILGSLLMTRSPTRREEREPEKGIEITLSVYSGRPNPQWWLTEGPEYEQVIRLVTALELTRETLFTYEEWNRLGYASFWITPRGIEELPYAVHVWRDMAYVAQDGDREAMQAVGATELYDVLVAQAEKRDQGRFFVNYHRYREQQESGG